MKHSKFLMAYCFHAVDDCLAGAFTLASLIRIEHRLDFSPVLELELALHA